MPRFTETRRQLVDAMMKEAIYRAAVAVLVEQGVDGMTMDRVAAAADVAKGSLYNYFQSKRELLQFVMARTIDPILQHLEELVGNELPATEKLQRHVRMLLEHCAEHAAVFNLFFREDAVHSIVDSSARSARVAAAHHLAAIFRQGMEEGRFRAGDADKWGHMFVGMCRGLFDSRPELSERGGREELARLLLGTFLEGIADGR